MKHDMTEFRPTAEADEPAEPAELIETLMRGPVKTLPSIVVVGDDDVFGITPYEP
jgi:hypothetical protein